MKKMRCFLCAFIVVFNIIFTDQEVQAHDPTLGRKWREEPGYTAKSFLKKTEGHRWTSVKGSLQSLHRPWTKSQPLEDLLLHTGLATRGEKRGLGLGRAGLYLLSETWARATVDSIYDGAALISSSFTYNV